MFLCAEAILFAYLWILYILILKDKNINYSCLNIKCSGDIPVRDLYIIEESAYFRNNNNNNEHT